MVALPNGLSQLNTLFIGFLISYLIYRVRVFHPQVIKTQFSGREWTLVRFFLLSIVSGVLGCTILSTQKKLPRIIYSVSTGSVVVSSVCFAFGILLTGSFAITTVVQLGVRYEQAIYVLLGIFVSCIAFNLPFASNIVGRVIALLDTLPSFSSHAEMVLGVPFVRLGFTVSMVTMILVFILENNLPAKKERRFLVASSWSGYIVGLCVGLVFLGALFLFNIKPTVSQSLNELIQILVKIPLVIMEPSKSHLSINNLISTQLLFFAGLILGSFLGSRAENTYKKWPMCHHKQRSFFGGVLLGLGALISKVDFFHHIIVGIPHLNTSSFQIVFLTTITIFIARAFRIGVR
ncbi:inner membrane protein yede [Anaeramoeba flamelloides]|uniref:Inner membrane protein yede n=1 Tax=Anaeramoeba flamelloides TaxID=1746091 RepID=A0AAV7Z815_9EUKA|nr:inner membrane protein yede [Anaeramoeba flamelloides]